MFRLCNLCTCIYKYHIYFVDWDLGVCLYYECKRKQIKTPTYFNQWVNIRALYKVYIKYM